MTNLSRECGQSAGKAHHHRIAAWVSSMGKAASAVPIFRNRSMTTRMAGATCSLSVVQRRSQSRRPRRRWSQFFGCGNVYVNRPQRQPSVRICTATTSPVRRPAGRDRPVLPGEPTANRRSETTSRKFAEIIELMDLRRHLTVPGLIEIAEIAQTMNFRKPSEALRILRDHTPTLFPVSREEDEMVRALRRRREADGNVSPPIRVRHLSGLQVTGSAKFLVG